MDDDWYPPERPAMPEGPEHFPATGVNSLASYGVRGVARAIDSLLIGLPVLAVGIGTLAATDADPNQGFPEWVAAVWFVLTVVYEVLFVRWRGQTLGKLAVGIKVSRLDNGRPPLWWQAGIRIALPAIAAGLPFGIASVAYVAVYSSSAWSPVRRGIHDKAAGTVVVVAR